MVERTVNWEFILVAGIITGTIMVGIFFMGQQLSDTKVDALTGQIEQVAVERESQDLSRRIAENLPNNNCRALRAAQDQTVEDLRQLRDDLDTYEQTRKLRNGRFDIVKQRYTNLLLEYWLTVEETAELCGSNVTTILYLFSDTQDCSACPDQGTILTKYRREYDTELLVFPLDTTLDMQPVNLIAETYNASTYPVMIIDGEAYHGFHSYAELGTILAEKMGDAS